jgi:hypothetical protein
LFSEEESNKIETNFSLLLNEQSSTTFEDHLLLFNEDDQEILRYFHQNSK